MENECRIRRCWYDSARNKTTHNLSWILLLEWPAGTSLTRVIICSFVLWCICWNFMWVWLHNRHLAKLLWNDFADYKTWWGHFRDDSLRLHGLWFDTTTNNTREDKTVRRQKALPDKIIVRDLISRISTQITLNLIQNVLFQLALAHSYSQTTLPVDFRMPFSPMLSETNPVVW